MSNEPAAAATGEVFDLGYQRYTGERQGRWRSRYAIWRDGVRASLGLGRSAGQKVLPFLFIGLTWGVALILIVVLVIVGGFDLEPGDNEASMFSGYYVFAQIFMTLFAATVAPALLCPDRRDGVLSLYLVRPITATDYIAARYCAFLCVTIAVVWIPQLLLFSAAALVEDEPLRWLGDNWEIVPRFLAAGALIAVMLTSVSFAVAAFTDRRLIAAITAVAVLFLGSVIAGIQVELAPGFPADVISMISGTWLITLSLTAAVFGQVADDPPEWWTAWRGFGVYVAGMSTLVAVLWWRYRTLTL